MQKIRTMLLIILVTICPLLWAITYVWSFGLCRNGSTQNYKTLESRDYKIYVWRGNVYLVMGGYEDLPPMVILPPGVEPWIKSPPPSGQSEWHWQCFYIYGLGLRGGLYDEESYAGFKWQWHPPDRSRSDYSFGFIRIPLWFPSLVNLILGGWLWWLYRRRRVWRGFPVDVQEPGTATQQGDRND